MNVGQDTHILTVVYNHLFEPKTYKPMTSLIIRLIISTVVVIVSSRVLQGFYVDTLTTSVIVAIVMGLLNTFLKPVLQFLSIPITILTLGLFYFIINIALVYLCAYLVDGFSISSIVAAFLFSISLSLIQWIAGWFLD
jgi:putative membrane protein